MMSIETNLRVAGVLMIALALGHVVYDRYLGWKLDTKQLKLLTRQVFYVHCFFICLVLVMMGLLSLFYASELLKPSPLSRALLIGMAVFWGFRTAIQWFGYDSTIWRGNRLFTMMHWVYSAIWIYLTGTFSLALRA